ncbi:hypothetical protein VW29_10030 [Devosia limi DSM 17137]|uniref:Ferric oxidoreductase domain-containing protein n=1 Tax=Devosia limi DSM 17137 TaxID=1121477 RepID=A0A0F5LQR5_9HYPH|nr:hypothetical protein VW29_10030 [Devosia limi DSM 17137]
MVWLLSAVAVAYFAWLRFQWDPMHLWNRALADASFVALAAAMALGPLVVFFPRLTRVLAYRRELGIAAAVLATAHAGVVFVGWVNLSIWQLMGFAFHPQLQRQVLAEHGLGLGNWLGFVAMVVALWLAALSNNWSMRLFGARTWKHLQQAAGIAWLFAVVHAAYFLFMHFEHFHRLPTPPNPVQLPMAALVVCVQMLRWSAVFLVWRRGRVATPAMRVRAASR